MCTHWSDHGLECHEIYWPVKNLSGQIYEYSLKTHTTV